MAGMASSPSAMPEPTLRCGNWRCASAALKRPAWQPHNGGWYVRHGHQIGSLLSDAEKLRTEWVTGKRMTSTRARQMDQTAANVDAVTEAMAILEKTRRSHA